MEYQGINFKDVSISINDHAVLHGINIDLEKGKSYAIMGPAGSGKTSLLKAIAGKLFPKNGKINKVGSIEFVPSDYKFHRFVGAVYQYYQQRYHAHDSELGPTLYEVLQNQVKPMGTIDDRSVELDDPLYDEAHLLNIATSFKIDHLLDRKITSLSTGETRRSLLARSILKQPDFLLLDNPYVGLDKESRMLLNEILSNQVDVSIVLVCGKNDLPAFIDDVIYLKSGAISEEGSLENEEVKIDPALVEKLAFNSQWDFETIVSFNSAKVTYNGEYALKDFSWTVRKGERWALMGPNGSGKSTVISLITADNPQAYRNDIVLFDQKRGTGESIWDIKKKMGFVSAELQLYCEKDIPVWKLVASGLFDTAGLYQELKDSELQTVFNYIRLIGIQDIAERPFNHLSNGEQRLVFLARALVKNPPLLILDEPCQGLDYNQMVHFRELLNQIVVAFDKTLIYVTHYEEEIPACVDKRIDLSEGSVLKIANV
ncbi:ATP-binding cassette domain-containing protein [Portibacter lacus]|uniref:Molybdenum ABC transporter ATP-binding protein n=1 Tax=Portibacter lacus TaxID=1099794 RepID=A0AA37SRR9_9BACT|nr:ATP-binding cassette domain-containing protein [Portibacter lacus]GLR17631.1 molybdenum ABC transporter ATP-binding protein [Portibacter lacus]